VGMAETGWRPTSGGQQRHLSFYAGLLGTVATILLPFVSTAQETRRGVALQFGVEQRLETDSNLGLDTPSQGRTTQATTRLSFQVTSDTGISQLTFGAGGLFRVANGPGTSGTDAGFADPSLTFGYGRTSASADLRINATIREQDISFLRALDAFIDDDGTIDLPDDFSDLNGEGTRRDASLDVTYRWGLDAPFGGSFVAGVRDLSYQDATDADLNDSRRYHVGAGLRFALSQVTELTTDLRYSTFDEDGVADSRGTLRLDTGLAITRPNGKAFGRLTAEDTEDGTRLGLTFGRDLELPAGALSASIGVTRDAEGDLQLTGALSGRQDLANGALTGSLQRTVRSDSDDAEEVLTNLRIGYTRELSPLSSLSLDLGYANSQSTATNDSTSNTSVSATYNRALTSDWNLDLGYRHRIRDTDTDGRANSDSVFLSLRRDFTN
jgi:hypothetical protein